MQVNKNIQSLSTYKIEITPKNVIRCHANESLEPIIDIDILTKDILNNIQCYPEEIYQNLTLQAAKFYNTDINYTIPVNGSDEGLDLIIRGLTNQNDKILILEPTFTMYKQYAIAHGLEIITYHLNGNLEIDIDKFISFAKDNNPALIIIPNPLAPSGGLTTNINLLKIIETLPNIFIVIDEAYIEYANTASMVNEVLNYKNLIVTRTLSKFFGLAGIRLGFVFTKFKDEICKIKSPYNVNTLSCGVGINLFKNVDSELISLKYQQNINDKEKIINFLKQFNEIEKIYDSYTNFVFCKVNDSKEFAKKMLVSYKIKIKSFLNNYCRVSCIKL